MAKKAYVRNSENTAWVELASSVTDLSAYQLKVDNVSDVEIGYLDGVTSNIQSQINAKLDTTIASNTYATISYTDTAVTTAVSNVIDASPTTLDTLNELAAALGDDPNFATTITNLVAEKMANVPGMISQYAGATSPNGWLICDGSAVSRTTYSSLFTAIGTTYGTGNGSTTFNLPNLKGRVVVGVDAAQTEFDALGETGGAKTVTLTSANIPPLSIKDTAGVIYVSRDGIVQPNVTSGWWRGLTSASGDRTVATDSSAGPVNNLQPYIAMNYIIKY